MSKRQTMIVSLKAIFKFLENERPEKKTEEETLEERRKAVLNFGRRQIGFLYGGEPLEISGI